MSGATRGNKEFRQNALPIPKPFSGNAFCRQHPQRAQQLKASAIVKLHHKRKRQFPPRQGKIGGS
jgi:hypothetical protein